MEELSERLKARLREPGTASELKTMETMTRLFCRGHRHTSDGSLCRECRELFLYSAKRLACCPYRGPGKPACGRCRIHCFQEPWRTRARTVMAWSGPRMILRHPVMALRHAASLLRAAPEKPKNNGRPARR